MIEHVGPISGVATNRGLVATAGYDNQLILWDAASGQSLARSQHDHLVNMCVFKNQDVFSASSDHTARRWRASDLQLLTVYSGHRDDVEMCAPSQSGRRLATACRDHYVRVFDVGGELLWTGAGHTADVISVAWNSDDTEVTSSGDDGTIRRWDAFTGRQLQTLDLDGVETDTVLVLPDGAVLAGSDDGQIVMFDGATRVATKAHSSGVKRLAHDGAGRIVSMSYDRTVKLWTFVDGELTLAATYDLPVEVWARSADFLGSQHLVCGSFGSSYMTLDLETGAWCHGRSRPTPGVNAVLSAAGQRVTVGDAGIVQSTSADPVPMGSLCNFLADWNGRIVTGGHSGELFDATTGAVLHQHRSPLNCAAVLPRATLAEAESAEAELIHAALAQADGLVLAVGTYTGEVLFFQTTGGQAVFAGALDLHDNAVKGLASNDSHLFSVCATGAAMVVDLADLSNRHGILDAHTRIANGVTALADGRFASVSRDRKLRLFTVGNNGSSWRIGAEVLDTPHTHSIKCVASHPSLPLVATGSYNGTVGIYDADGDRWVNVSRPTASGISSITAEPDGSAFLASSYDGRVYASEIAPAWALAVPSLISQPS